MNISKIISQGLDLSNRSKVPFLFLSNPGVGKTTSIKEYAKSHGYKVTELRGAQSTPEDILGFYANNPTTNKLEMHYPDWFSKIISDKEPHILFIDELTTSSEFTQAALLKLIFDRAINDVELPDSTIIVAAGNYLNNLSLNFSMISPIINRFCIINLDTTVKDLSEYINLEGFVEPSEKFEYKDKEVSKELVIKLMNEYVEELFKEFSITKNPEFSLILKNKDFSSLFSFKDEIYNIISPRTIHYLTKVTYHIARSNGSYEEDFIKAVVLGLIGFGTLSFAKLEGFNEYQRVVAEKYMNMLSLIK